MADLGEQVGLDEGMVKAVVTHLVKEGVLADRKQVRKGTGNRHSVNVVGPPGDDAE
jgi:DNA-binding transcriptional regulator PaaX